jgi:uncharacterized protein (TIGR03000 family)
LGLGYPYWAYDRFGPGVWIGSDAYPGYFSYYGDDGANPDGIYYGPSGSALTAIPPDVNQEEVAQALADISQNGAPADSQTETRASIAIRVPTGDTRLWIEDQETTGRGLVREFRSPALEKGHNYIYEIRAEWKEGDQVKKQTRKFPVHSGDHIMVVFGTMEAASQPKSPAQ